MHTKDQQLDSGETVSMTYSTDVVPNSAHPMIEMHQEGTEFNPDLAHHNKPFRINGGWYHFNDNNVHMSYLIDRKKYNLTSIDELKNTIKSQGTSIEIKPQSDEDMNKGKRHPWESFIDTSKLDEGVHSVVVTAWDNQGRTSSVKEIFIKIPPKPKVMPQLSIDSHINQSKDTPFDPMEDNSLTVKGTWIDGDSSNMNLTYQIDDQDEVYLQNDYQNNPGNTVEWALENLNLSQFNDTKLHKIIFKLSDETSSVTKEFYFQHKTGFITVNTPDKFTFGFHHLIPNKLKDVNGEFSGGIVLNDYRGTTSKARLTLDVGPFQKVSGSSSDTLNAKISVDDQMVDEQHPLTLASDLVSEPDVWKTKHILTDKIKDKLKLNINHNGSQISGKYISKWTWIAIDSCNDSQP